MKAPEPTITHGSSCPIMFTFSSLHWPPAKNHAVMERHLRPQNWTRFHLAEKLPRHLDSRCRSFRERHSLHPTQSRQTVCQNIHSVAKSESRQCRMNEGNIKGGQECPPSLFLSRRNHLCEALSVFRASVFRFGSATSSPWRGEKSPPLARAFGDKGPCLPSFLGDLGA